MPDFVRAAIDKRGHRISECTGKIETVKPYKDEVGGFARFD